MLGFVSIVSKCCVMLKVDDFVDRRILIVEAKLQKCGHIIIVTSSSYALNMGVALST